MRSLAGTPQLHVQMSTNSTFEVDGVVFNGIETTIDLPSDAMLESCRVDLIPADVAFEPIASLGRTRALRVSCQALPRLAARLHAVSEWSSRSPLRQLLKLLFMPMLLLLIPGLLSFRARPLHCLAGISLTLVSVISLSCITTVCIVLAQKHVVHYLRRWHRLWNLRLLMRQAGHVSSAFGTSGPCCICLGEPTSVDPVIALLPCRHALHRECYLSWVRADGYRSRDLICPMCRRRAEAIGKLPP
jgi:hypothetical protein